MGKRNIGKWYMRGSWRRRLHFNRKYKDVLFRHLFQDRKDLLELYNALNGSSYDKPEELEVVTMEDVIFMKMKNDLSFIIGSHLNLYEHQSTWNPNMPFRREEAICIAMDACIEKGILKDILSKQKAEVLHMLLTEYDEKKHMRTLFQEGREEGMAAGREEGIAIGRNDIMRELVQKKLSKGKSLSEIAGDLEEDISVIERIASDFIPK